MNASHLPYAPVELRHDALSIGVLPALGGALAYVRQGTFDLLRPWDGSDSVRRTACYPLLPWSNRIDSGRFCVDGVTHQLQRNFGTSPHTLHGVGWQRSWTVFEQCPAKCLLLLSHDAEEASAGQWPFAFDAYQTIRVDAQGVHLELLIRNRSAQRMPTGLGWHPYFPRRDELHMQFRARRVWHNGLNELPERATEVPAPWDFREARAIGHVGLDNCFEGWDGEVRLRWPQAGHAVHLRADSGLGHLVVFTPPEPADFIAVEPVSHLTDAVNRRGDHGLVWLEPGQVLARRMHILPGIQPASEPEHE